MTTLDTIVRGGKIVSATEVYEADIGIKDGVVAAIGRDLGPCEKIVDATGLLVLPGGVDTHVHLEQTGLGPEMCDTWESGTASAAAGGTTTVVCFAWQSKGGSLAAITADYHIKARQARVDYSFHLTVTDPTSEVLDVELPRLIAEGCRSVKVFMTYDGVRLDDRQALRVLAAARRNEALVCVHAENHDLIAWLTEQLVSADLTTPKFHAYAKPMIAEREAVYRIISLAEALDVPIQIFHVSGAQSAEEIARAQARGLKVWGETCVHYLTLTADDLDRPGFEGAKFIFGPPARTKADQEALWGYLKRGVIEVVSSDHSPTRFDDPKGKKFAGDPAPFNKVPNGIPGLAARLPVLFTEGVSKGRIDLPTFVRLTSTNPAKLFGLFPQKGSLAVGSDADFILWDAEKSVILTNELMHHGGDYTPYEGYRTRGYPVATYLRGKAIFDGRTVTGPAGGGRFIARPPYPMSAPLERFPTPFNAVDGHLV